MPGISPPRGRDGENDGDDWCREEVDGFVDGETGEADRDRKSDAGYRPRIAADR